MKSHDINQHAYKILNSVHSRRKFLGSLGLTAAGLFLSRYTLSNNLLRIPGLIGTNRSNQVAVTQGDNYEYTFIRDKVEHLFDSLGGISDVVQPGDKVGIKINITGGSGYANHPNLDGVDIRECAWTHPEVLRAVGELLIDSGVNGNDIYIVEGIWDDASYDQFGYSEVQQYLGANVVNLNTAAPYANFILKSTGPDYYYYASFVLNKILEDIDVFVSIPKMKQHYTAGITHSMKNLIGIAPLNSKSYIMKPYSRDWLHSQGGEEDWYHLPRSICDLNMARPINLAVIDGIKNAVGGEGPWNATFTPYEDHYLLAGKNAVSTDSIAAYIMGNNPEPPQLLRPDGTFCDNHLYLASQKGMGTNILNEIELVGDGAGTITGITEEGQGVTGTISARLYPNQPNPFRVTTQIRYYLPESCMVSLGIFNEKGQEIDRLCSEIKSSGNHTAEWKALGQSPGIYIIRLIMSGKILSRKIQLIR
jgi:uncharacterized protein (DUF362 family)